MSIMRRAASSGMLAASRVMGNPTVRKAQGHWRTMNQMASMADALGWVQHTDPQPRSQATTFVSRQPFPQPSATYQRPAAPQPPQATYWHPSAEEGWRTSAPVSAPSTTGYEQQMRAQEHEQARRDEYENTYGPWYSGAFDD